MPITREYNKHKINFTLGDIDTDIFSLCLTRIGIQTDFQNPPDKNKKKIPLTIISIEFFNYSVYTARQSNRIQGRTNKIVKKSRVRISAYMSRSNFILPICIINRSTTIGRVQRHVKNGLILSPTPVQQNREKISKKCSLADT